MLELDSSVYWSRDTEVMNGVGSVYGVQRSIKSDRQVWCRREPTGVVISIIQREW